MAAALLSAAQAYEIFMSFTQHLHLNAPSSPQTQPVCAVLIFSPSALLLSLWSLPDGTTLSPQLEPGNHPPTPASILLIHLTHMSYSFLAAIRKYHQLGSL